jgi:hypothetical protein
MTHLLVFIHPPSLCVVFLIAGIHHSPAVVLQTTHPAQQVVPSNVKHDVLPGSPDGAHVVAIPDPLTYDVAPVVPPQLELQHPLPAAHSVYVQPATVEIVRIAYMPPEPVNTVA